MKPEDRPLHCGQRMRPIVYGMPDLDLIELSREDKVELGGCVVEDGLPLFRCVVCNRTEGRLGDDFSDHMEDDDWE